MGLTSARRVNPPKLGTGSGRREFGIHSVAAVSALLFAWPACRASPRPAATPKPRYTPEEAAVFDDVFRPELFGHPGMASPDLDGLLPDRVAAAHSVAPARVVTVTRDEDGERRSYTVVVASMGPALVGRSPVQPVSLRVTGTSPVFAWVDGAGAQWVGTRLLLFLRYFEDGAHFHATPDTEAMRNKVLRFRMRQGVAR